MTYSITRTFIDGATRGSIRGHNRGLVLKRVFEARRISRAQIALDTGLTAAAISRITRELIDLNLLREGSLIGEEGRPGRRSIELSLPHGGMYVVGIGAGAFEQRLRIANLSGGIAATRTLHLIGLDAEAAAAAIVDALRHLFKQEEFRASMVIACGIAMAGVVDPVTGKVITSPNFGWNDFPLASILEKELGLPVAVESMHHALNLAEASFGQTVGVDNVLLVNAALGIGASILADGRVFRGSGTAAGQIGHLPIEGVTEVGTGGRRGCLDTVASGHAVLTQLGLIPLRDRPREHKPNDPNLLKSAMERAAEGDHTANMAFKSAGAHLGKALAAIRMVTDPERIILAGPLAQVLSYVEGTREALLNSRTTDEELPPVLVSDQQSDAAGAWVALERFVFSERLNPSTFKML